MKKTIDYTLGIITGIAIMIAIWSYTTPLYAEASGGPKGTRWDPIYVKVAD